MLNYPRSSERSASEAENQGVLALYRKSGGADSGGMEGFTGGLAIPDLWQQEAVRLLRAGRDVVVHAPTGAGKTLVFELLVEEGLAGQVVFTVPTRALANDKLVEWRARGWRVGIETGDLSVDRDAPVVVATLETQKRRLLAGRGPALLVVDEYQMLGDPARGLNYELALALAPASTRLLLLSGSVGNPGAVADWLRRGGREVGVVDHRERPVPLDEVPLDALPDRVPKTVHGRWPRLLARALQAGLGPVLVFAPRRRAAEDLARSLAAALPAADPLILSPEQRVLAGPALARVLKQRVAFHHSGLVYAQRAGLVESLAKANQLQIIVATTGLAAGINFSLRSVLVLDREYRVADRHRLLRPDELLQMFGRAGRRGLDERGSVLVTGGLPRLSDARPLRLRRRSEVDWPALMTVLQAAVERGESPLAAARDLTARLFAEEPVRLGLDDFLRKRPARARTAPAAPGEQVLGQAVVREFLNSEGVWERRRAPVKVALEDAWVLEHEKWRPALSTPRVVGSLRIGTLYKSGAGAGRRYGRTAPLAFFPTEAEEDRLHLARWLRSALREHQRARGLRPNVPRLWRLEAIECEIIPLLPELTRGGRAESIDEKAGALVARLDYARALIDALVEKESGRALLNPPERSRVIGGAPEPASPGLGGFVPMAGGSIAETWFALGLIDASARPTRRGIVFSFFNHGEGLAVAAALEEAGYAIEELVQDLANLRAGHRFSALSLGSRPLAAACHRAYGQATVPGYLRHGLPEDYGDGASEVLAGKAAEAVRQNDELSRGDIERARAEWRSLRAHIAHAPGLDWVRWEELRAACRDSLGPAPTPPTDTLPPLTRAQRKRPTRTIAV